MSDQHHTDHDHHLTDHDHTDHTDLEHFTRGMQIRREVLGDAHVDRSVEGQTAFSAPFQDFITRTAWGDVWLRPGLDRQTRSVITLTALLALGHHAELAIHVRGAMNNGLTPEQIGEVFLQAAVYAGVPAANTAFAIAQTVFDTIGDDQPEATQTD
jgi:4-carboxymuconolactone decarboxylase